MKSICFLSLALILFFTTTAKSQDFLEKQFCDSDKKLGGDVEIIKSIITIEGSKCHKIFEIESPDYGNYYLNAWIMGAELVNFGSGIFIEYDLTVNNEKLPQKMKPRKSNWHNASYVDEVSKEKKTVILIIGLNQIIFTCDLPQIPEIEFIRLSKDKDKSEISEVAYNEFIDDLKKQQEDRINPPKNYNSDSIQSSLKSSLKSSDQVQIMFGVQAKSNVNIDIYDLSGRLIEHILNNEQKEKGNYTISHNIKNYKNGIYIIKYQDGNKVSSNKLQISK